MMATSAFNELIQIMSEDRAHCPAALPETTQPAITCSKLTVETLEQGVKYVQS